MTKKLLHAINEWTAYYTSSVFVLSGNRQEYIIRRKVIMRSRIKEDNNGSRTKGKRIYLYNCTSGRL